MALTLNQFIKKYDGKRVEYDGGGNYQCLDLARLWIHNIDGFQPPRVLGAKDMWTMADPDHWVKAKNAATNYPPAGAVVVFGARKGNPYGHIAIARTGSTSSKLLTFDQNWSRHRRCALETHDYTADRVIGWLVKR